MQSTSCAALVCSVRMGFIPNVFGERDSQPSYNTVDASLWYVDCVYQYLKYTNDVAFVRELCRHCTLLSRDTKMVLTSASTWTMTSSSATAKGSPGWTSKWGSTTRHTSKESCGNPGTLVQRLANNEYAFSHAWKKQRVRRASTQR